MKTKFSLTLLFICLFATVNAQTNKATVSYDLKKTFTNSGNVSVGGDLVITPEEPANTIQLCENENQNNQVVYSGRLLASAFLNVNNTNGAGCVTIVIISNGRPVKQTIPAGAESGVLSFSKVTSITISIDRKTTQTFPETVLAKGTVDFWF